ncbi:lipase [Cubamyces sp. BRFM 1775]|nr:lipase [Cubamyces sp. BRFM 1775]
MSALMASSTKVQALVALLVASLAAQAVALPLTSKRQSITALTQSEVATYTPYTHYASAGYCKPAATLAWNCGANCEANPSFIPVASGGDSVVTQFWFVGYDPTLGEVIVSHQGTDPDEILPLLEDADIILESLDPGLFPGVSSGVHAHSGFAGSQSRSASDVLAAVRTALSKFDASKITVTGHSLGAAIGLIDSVFLHLQLPKAAIRFVGYGLPRVGNQAFADYVDSLPISVSHINNMEDLVPILPGRFLGFHHPSGEIHIQDSGAWLSCPGQDNTSDQCIVGDVPNIFEGDTSFHDGPYNGVEIGC